MEVSWSCSYQCLNHRKSRGQLYNLFDPFSFKADNYDADRVNKFLETNIPRFDGKGYGLYYGIKYLLKCLKTDNDEYSKGITENDLMIECANDDIGASEIVINLNKDIPIICIRVLNVKTNDVWVSNHK